MVWLWPFPARMLIGSLFFLARSGKRGCARIRNHEQNRLLTVKTAVVDIADAGQIVGFTAF